MRGRRKDDEASREQERCRNNIALAHRALPAVTCPEWPQPPYVTPRVSLTLIGLEDLVVATVFLHALQRVLERLQRGGLRARAACQVLLRLAHDVNQLDIADLCLLRHLFRRGGAG